MFSVHFTVPSIRKSTELTVVPLGVAVHFTGPVSVAPLAMLEVTTKEDGGGGGGGGGGGDGFLPLAIVTVTDWLVAWLFPASRWAFTVSLCCPSGSDVVSKRPAGSPPNWYGAVGSVHLDDPSIRNSILFGVPPDDAVHVT